MITEQLDTLENMAYLLIPIELIAINLEINYIDLEQAIKTIGTDEHKRFYAGYIRQLTETREAVVRSAHNGSNPAQLELISFIKNAENNLRYG